MAQTRPKEKPPTQKEMQEMMKEAQKMAGELSAEDKRMMDSLGIKMPDFTNVPNVSGKQLAQAWEDENRVVPKRDAARIAAIPKAVSDARMETYLAAIQKKIIATLDADLIKMGDKLYTYIQSNSKNSDEAGNMATALWVAGKPQMAVYVLGKVNNNDPSNTDNLSNYAAMLSMQGAQHLAIPILDNLNAKFPDNGTILNNLGQAWLGLGELLKAEKYIDRALVLYSFHPQANMAKAAIAESKGNNEKAKEAVKKSIQHAYTPEKEEKLARLGEKLSHTQYLLPPRRKTDVLNLDGFRSPYFPMSSLGCINAEIEWKAFYQQIDEKINSLSKLRRDAEDAAMKGSQRRMNENVAYIRSAQANPGKNGQMLAVPTYATRAAKKLNATMSLMQRKMEAYNSRMTLYAQESLQLKKAYDEEMKKLRREDEAQTGSQRANEAYCPKYRTATDKYLKDINGKLQALYLDALTLKKEMINESAHYTMYMMWPDEFQVAKLDYQIEWLNFLKKGFGAPAYGSGFPFVSITLNEYSCNSDPKEEPALTKLQNFDDVHCEYHSELNWKVFKISNDCSRMTTEIDVDFFKYARKDDFERAEGDTYISSTVKVTGKVGTSRTVGPVKVGASAGVSVEVEIDRKGTKEVTLTGGANVSVGTDVVDKGAPGKGNIEKSVSIGVEGRISIISGQGSVSGTGILSGVEITSF